jgi:hypothetical protein
VFDYDEEPSVELSVHQATELRRILENPDTYPFGIAKGCIPRYGVRFRFESDDGPLEVRLCFGCNMLEVTRDKSSVGGGGFDSARSKLVALCKELFPNDKVIQRMDPRRANADDDG